MKRKIEPTIYLNTQQELSNTNNFVVSKKTKVNWNDNKNKLQ